MTDRDDISSVKRKRLPAFVRLVGIVVIGVVLSFVLVLFVMPRQAGQSGFDWFFGLFRDGPNTGMAVLLVLLQLLLTVPLAVLFVVGLFFGAVGKSNSRRRAVVLLRYVAAAVRLRLPIPVYLRAAAENESRGVAKRLRYMADGIEAGRSLAAVLEHSARALSLLTLDRIAAAERVGTLDCTLDAITQRECERLSEQATRKTAKPYGVLTIGFMIGITSVVMIFVIPKFVQIFNDYKIALPESTQWLIWVARSWPFELIFIVMAGGLMSVGGMAGFLLSPAAFALSVAGVWMFATRAYRAVRHTRGYRATSAAVLDPVIWYLPVIGRIVRDRQCATACETMADALNAGLPMPDAIQNATLPTLNRVLRRRLAHWRQAVTNGQPASVAARDAGLPELWCDLLAGDQSSPGVSVAFAGRVFAASAARRAVMVDAVLPVLGTLLLAGGVAFVAIALFSPMVSLISTTG